MQPEQRAELRRWAGRLGESGQTQETRAAGRAIGMLVDELERLQAVTDRLRAELEERDEAEREQERRTRDRPARRGRRERPRDEGGRSAVAVAEPEPVRVSSVSTLSPLAPALSGAATLPPAPAELPTPDAYFVPEPESEPSAWPRRERRPKPRRTLPTLSLPTIPPRARRLALVGAGSAALLLGGATVAARAAAPDLEASGPEPGALIGAAALPDLAFSVRGSAGSLRDARWTLNGEDVTASAKLAGSLSILRGSELPDGAHTLAVSVPGPFPGASASHEWTFELDRTGPELVLDATSLEAPPALPLELKGAAEPGATVVANGREAEVAEDGTFAIGFEEPPAKPIAFVATDRFGNATQQQVALKLVPRRPRAPLRSVHVTFHAWADDELRGEIMRLVDEGRVNSVELDLKDESGIVGFASGVPLAEQVGAEQVIYDLKAAVELLHSKGIHVIGRIVAFRDPIHAPAAWKAGNRAQVIQTPGGEPYAGYGGFTNFANPAVRKYNIDVGVAAAALGVDDILYDYVRRPDGPTSGMVFPGLKGTAEASIASFLKEARQALKPYQVFLGASVFGVAATRPLEVAQDIPAMARHVDYIAPMVYPSHWGPGEYGVANPNGQPYEITKASVADFITAVEGTGARVVPWLQDFTYGVTYGPAEVRAQIEAGADLGIEEYILWDAAVTYTRDALDPKPKLPPIPARQLPKPAAATPAAAPASGGAKAAAATVKADELGRVPVLMYHQIRADGGGDYDLTPAQFRAELARLHREGYVPITAADLATGRIDVPAGKSPVVLTFDDSTKEQLAWDDRKRPKPGTAIAIMLDFAKENPGFEPAGTFYVNREPFAGDPRGDEMLRWLHDNGFELGNHTRDHIPFNELNATEVQKQLVLGAKLITDAVPRAKVRTMALPLGVPPEPAALARKGSWQGTSYAHAGVLLVGAEPSPSPFAAGFRPGAIPRIRTAPKDARDPLMGSAYWLDDLARPQGRRYVSDGDPETISFPKARAGELAKRFEARANPY